MNKFYLVKDKNSDKLTSVKRGQGDVLWFEEEKRNPKIPPIQNENGQYIYEAAPGTELGYVERSEDELKTELIQQKKTEIKQKCEHEIFATYSPAIQFKALKRSAEILEILFDRLETLCGGTIELPPEIEVERQKIKASGIWIDHMTNQSDQFEAELESLTEYDDIKNYKPVYNKEL